MPRTFRVLGLVTFAWITCVPVLTGAQASVFSSRTELTRFLCTAFQSGDIASTMKAFNGLNPVQESTRSGGSYVIHTLVRRGDAGTISYEYMRFLRDGQTANHVLKLQDEDVNEAVWFQNDNEARAWLQSAGLLTRTEPFGVKGYAGGSETDSSRRDRASEPRFDFTVVASSIGMVELTWNRQEQVRHGAALCSAR